MSLGHLLPPPSVITSTHHNLDLCQAQCPVLYIHYQLTFATTWYD